MKEPIDYRALALQALQVKPSGEWGCSDLQRHYTLSYTQAVHLLEAIKEVASDDMGEEPPATAEGQPELFADLTLQQTTMPSVTEALARERERLSPTGRASRSDKGKPRGPKTKPTAPESAPAVAPVDVPVMRILLPVELDLTTGSGQKRLVYIITEMVLADEPERAMDIIDRLIRSLTTPAA